MKTILNKNDLMNTLSNNTVNNLERSTLNVGLALYENFNLTGLINSFSTLFLTQVIYIFTAGTMILSTVLPWYF